MTTTPSLFIRLYLDENVHPAVAVALRTRGFDAVSAHEVRSPGGVGRRATGVRSSRRASLADLQCGGFSESASGKSRNAAIPLGHSPMRAIARRRGGAAPAQRVEPHDSR